MNKFSLEFKFFQKHHIIWSILKRKNGHFFEILVLQKSMCYFSLEKWPFLSKIPNFFRLHSISLMAKYRLKRVCQNVQVANRANVSGPGQATPLV